MAENQEALAAERTQGSQTTGSVGEPTLLDKLTVIADEIFERWNKDQRSGKLLIALSGALPRYRADVTEIRAALATHAELVFALAELRDDVTKLRWGQSYPGRNHALMHAYPVATHKRREPLDVDAPS